MSLKADKTDFQQRDLNRTSCPASSELGRPCAFIHLTTEFLRALRVSLAVKEDYFHFRSPVKAPLLSVAI